MEYKCIHCDEKFESKKRLKIEDRYCPYCKIVHLGKPDDGWIPTLSVGDLGGSGFS